MAASLILLASVGSFALASDATFNLMPVPNGAFGGTWNVSISADGSSVSGYFGNPNASNYAFEWKVGSNPTLLPNFYPTAGSVWTSGIGFDGTQVCGTSFSTTMGVFPAGTVWNNLVPSQLIVLGPPNNIGAILIYGMDALGKNFIGSANGGYFLLHNGTYTNLANQQPIELSPNGRYLLISGSGGYSVEDLTTSTTTGVTAAPSGSTLVAVSNNGIVTGYDNNGSFYIKSNVVTRLLSTIGVLKASAISQDGSVIVGTLANSGKGFIWTSQWGVRDLQIALAEQGASPDPIQMGFILDLWPQSLTVVDGVANIAGMCQDIPQSPITAFKASLRVSQPGLPIDLNGSYLAVKNGQVAATTDPHGIVGEATPGNQVLEPAPGFVSAPFSDHYKPPHSFSGIDMVGHSYWFDVDLGPGANWPNPSSTQNYYAGQAAIGQEGAELQVRASASTAHGITVGDNDGLIISFYQKDGHYTAHVTNLWYDQDITIPVAADITKYHVNVALATTGAITITVTAGNGKSAVSTGAQATALTLAGGSTDMVGLNAASFMVSLYNVTPPTQTTASPTTPYVGGFATDAISDALYAFIDAPYVGALNHETVAGRLNAANLLSVLTGYAASLDLFGFNTVFPIGGTGNGATGTYENTLIFTQPGSPSFAPDANYHFNHAQRTHSGNLGKGDLLLETYEFSSPVFGNNGAFGPFNLDILPLFNGGPAPSTLFTTNGAVIPTNLVSSNAIMVDTLAPTLSGFTATAAGRTVGGNSLVVSGQTVNVAVTATDVGSGLATDPVLTVAPFDFNLKPLPAITVPLGSLNSIGNFAGSFVVPVGAASLSLTVNVSDRAQNAATPATITLHSGLTTTVTLSNTKIAKGTTVQRVLRVVIGGTGFTPVAVNKVVTFDSTGVGTLQLTDLDGLPSPANSNANILYVKDPYHTLGKQNTILAINGYYTLGPVSTITLTPGDANNDNMVDISDLAQYAALLGTGGSVTANTTSIADSSLMLTMAQLNPDFNADGKLDDSSLIQSNFSKLGDADPSLPAPGPAKTTLTYAQATALGVPAWIQQAIDTNHDGKLTEAEILAWIKTIGS